MWVSVIAICVIGLLEALALYKGIDGKGLALALAAIALLAPSPIFQIQWGKWKITKGKGGE